MAFNPPAGILIGIYNTPRSGPVEQRLYYGLNQAQLNDRAKDLGIVPGLVAETAMRLTDPTRDDNAFLRAALAQMAQRDDELRASQDKLAQQGDKLQATQDQLVDLQVQLTLMEQQNKQLAHALAQVNESQASLELAQQGDELRAAQEKQQAVQHELDVLQAQSTATEQGNKQLAYQLAYALAQLNENQASLEQQREKDADEELKLWASLKHCNKELVDTRAQLSESTRKLEQRDAELGCALEEFDELLLLATKQVTTAEDAEEEAEEALQIRDDMEAILRGKLKRRRWWRMGRNSIPKRKVACAGGGVEAATCRGLLRAAVNKHAA